MKAIDERCCICGEWAIKRSFDGTGWCQIHLSDWLAFLRWERVHYDSLDATFQAWIKIAKQEENDVEY